MEREAEKAGKIELASQIYIEKGLILTRIGRHEEAAELFRKALENYEKLGDESGIADSAYNLCIALSNLGEYETPEYVADTTYALGLAYLEGEQTEKGVELLNEALKEYKKLKNEEGEASVLLDLGNAQLDLEDLDKALEYYKKALKKFEGMNDRVSYADTLVCMAEVFEEREEPVKAADNYLKAVQVYVEENLKETAEDYIKRVENMLWDLPKSSRRRIRKLVDELKNNI
ncbi:MAG: tetratricopeptide repeat protein, partial [Candidatus Freyarchaeota archaeon]